MINGTPWESDVEMKSAWIHINSYVLSVSIIISMIRAVLFKNAISSHNAKTAALNVVRCEVTSLYQEHGKGGRNAINLSSRR